MTKTSIRNLQQRVQSLLVEEDQHKASLREAEAAVMTTVPQGVKLYGPVVPKSGAETASVTGPNGDRVDGMDVKYGYFPVKEPCMVMTPRGKEQANAGDVILVGKVEIMEPMTRQQFETEFNTDIDGLRSKMDTAPKPAAGDRDTSVGAQYIRSLTAKDREVVKQMFTTLNSGALVNKAEYVRRALPTMSDKAKAAMYAMMAQKAPPERTPIDTAIMYFINQKYRKDGIHVNNNVDAPPTPQGYTKLKSGYSS